MLLFRTLHRDRRKVRLMAGTWKTYVAFIDFAVINDSKGGLMIHAHTNSAWE